MSLLHYCITPHDINKSTLTKLFSSNTHINKKKHKNKIDFICLRASKSNSNQLSLYYSQITKKYKRKNQIQKAFCKDIQIAKKYKLDGIHLKNFEVSKIKQTKRAKLKCIISCHNKKQIRQAIICGADYITYSPVFASKGRDGFGIWRLKIITNKFKQIKIFALGGIISTAHIKKLYKINTKNKQNLYGFGSIRYFK